MVHSLELYNPMHNYIRLNHLRGHGVLHPSYRVFDPAGDVQNSPRQVCAVATMVTAQVIQVTATATLVVTASVAKTVSITH